VRTDDAWGLEWGSVHEAAHAVVAHYFHLEVKLLTMEFARVRYPRSKAPQDDASMMQLIVSAAGDAAAQRFSNWTGTGSADDELERQRLAELGADSRRIEELMRVARETADALVQQLEAEILTVAKALRERRSLTGRDIEALLSDS
jgi:hypothetical protein